MQVFTLLLWSWDWALPVHSPHVVTAVNDLALGGELVELVEGVWGEADLVGDDNPGLASELEGSPPESLDSLIETFLTRPAAHNAAAVVGAADGAVWLTEGVPHTGLKSIGTSGRKHLVDSEDVEWVEVDTDVVGLTHGLHHVTVRADTSSFEGFTGNVFVLEEDEADAVWVGLSKSGPGTSLVTLDTWIWNTTAEAALWIWTALEVTVATSWTTAHSNKA